MKLDINLLGTDESRMQRKEPIGNGGNRASQHEKWLQSWQEFEQEFQERLKWAQKILIQDINTAFKNRIRWRQKSNEDVSDTPYRSD